MRHRSPRAKSEEPRTSPRRAPAYLQLSAQLESQADRAGPSTARNWDQHDSVRGITGRLEELGRMRKDVTGAANVMGTGLSGGSANGAARAARAATAMTPMLATAAQQIDMTHSIFDSKHFKLEPSLCEVARRGMRALPIGSPPRELRNGAQLQDDDVLVEGVRLGGTVPLHAHTIAERHEMALSAAQSRQREAASATWVAARLAAERGERERKVAELKAQLGALQQESGDE